MFKRVLSTIIDLVIFLIGAAVVTLVLAAVLYFLVAGRDASHLTNLLKNQLDIMSIVWYVLMVLLAYAYWVFVPSRYGYTIGMGLQKLTYTKYTPNSLLVYNLLAVWWRVLLFPIWLYMLWRGKDFGSWLSGVTMHVPSKFALSRAVRWLAVVHVVVLIVLIGSYYMISRVGFNEFVGRFIDYRTQIDLFIGQENWSEAQYALDRFVHYKGDQPVVTYYRCLIADGNRDWENAQTECEKALTTEITDEEKVHVQYAVADVYQNNSEEDKALATYEELWKAGRRDYAMIYYAQMLTQRDKAKDAFQVITDVLDQNKDLSTEQQFVLQRLQADLAAQKGDYDKSIELYTALLDEINGNKINFDQISAEKDGLIGEIVFEQAKAYYAKKDYSKAKELFMTAKDKNPSYGDLIDSYLIDIDLKTKK